MVQQLSHALSADCGDRVYRNPLWLEFRLDGIHRAVVPVVDYVDFVGGNDLGPPGDIRIVGVQLLIDGVDIFNGVAPFRTGRVHDMDNHLSALDMAQELMPQPDTLRGSLNQPRDVRDDESVGAVQIHHAQVGVQGGKVVVCDFRLRVGDPGEKCGFAHVGQPYQTYIRNDLQLQQDFQLLCRTSRLGVGGGLHGAGGIVLVPAAAAPAL